MTSRHEEVAQTIDDHGYRGWLRFRAAPPLVAACPCGRRRCGLRRARAWQADRLFARAVLAGVADATRRLGEQMDARRARA